VVNSDGGDLKQLQPRPNWGFQLEPTLPEWSPDGESLFFVAESLMQMSPDEQFQESARPDDFFTEDEAWSNRQILDIVLSPNETYLAVICLPENADDPITLDGNPLIPVLVLINVNTSTWGAILGRAWKQP
jgi:hypothetical protein